MNLLARRAFPRRAVQACAQTSDQPGTFTLTDRTPFIASEDAVSRPGERTVPAATSTLASHNPAYYPPSDDFCYHDAATRRLG